MVNYLNCRLIIEYQVLLLGCFWIATRNSGVGCPTDTEFDGAREYKDDLNALNDNVNHLYTPLLSNRILCLKTTSINFGVPITQQDSVYLLYEIIIKIHKMRHLGNIVHSNLSDLPYCKTKWPIFNVSANKLFVIYKGLNQETMCQFF